MHYMPNELPEVGILLSFLYCFGFWGLGFRALGFQGLGLRRFVGFRVCKARDVVKDRGT